jgi:hypothetical protein
MSRATHGALSSSTALHVSTSLSEGTQAAVLMLQRPRIDVLSSCARCTQPQWFWPPHDVHDVDDPLHPSPNSW